MSGRTTRHAVAGIALAVLCVTPVAHAADVIENAPLLPPAVDAGGVTLTDLTPLPPTVKVVDGRIGDWAGTRSGYAGTTRYAAGELVYEDHVFDAYGADDGKDTATLTATGPLTDAVPSTWRAESMPPQFPGFGCDAVAEYYGNGEDPPGWDVLRATDQCNWSAGDAEPPAGLREAADLVELRLAQDGDDTFVLARVGQMRSTAETALLLLVGPDEGSSVLPVGVPFNSGLTTSFATHAYLFAGDGGRVADLSTGAVTLLPAGSVATRHDGFDNAIEARLPTPVPGPFRVAAATGYLDASTGDLLDIGPATAPINVANAAFREEPVSTFMDARQSTELFGRTLDSFTAVVDPGALRSGRTQGVVPTAGYHERVFASTTPGLAIESEPQQGLFQQYGLYVPAAFRPGGTNPVTLGLHGAYQPTHNFASWFPRFIRGFGEDRGNVMAVPSARGTHTGYLGVGYADILEVIADLDADATIGRDADRTYAAGYSMGAIGAQLFSSLHPDLFAATFLGDGGVRPPWRHMVGNSVPVRQSWYRTTGVREDYDRVSDLGAQMPSGGEVRYYDFSSSEHVLLVLGDEWAEAVDHMGDSRRLPDPERVRFSRYPAIETGVRDAVFQDAAFPTRALEIPVVADGAFWVDDIELRAGDPTSLDTSGDVDITTHARGHRSRVPVAESGAGPTLGQSQTWVMEGVTYLPGPTTSPAANAFEALVRNVSSLTLAGGRMGLDPARRIDGTVDTDGPVTIHLEDLRRNAGIWVDGRRVGRAGDGTAVIAIPAGTHDVRIA